MMLQHYYNDTSYTSTNRLPGALQYFDIGLAGSHRTRLPAYCGSYVCE